MPYKTIQESLSAATWNNLGAGSYNQTYISKEHISSDYFTGQWVLKKPTISSDPTENNLNSVDRAIRKWNLHNPEYPAITTSEGYWIIPYFGNTPASDQQISEKLIEIYQNTGNIITDACGNKNFLMYQGTVICIDVDFSLRRGSFASNPWLEGERLSNITSYLEGWRHEKPQTTAIIRTLLYLDRRLQDQSAGQHRTITEACIAEHMHMQLTDLTDVVAIAPNEFQVMIQFIKRHNNTLLNTKGSSGYTLLHLAESLGYERARLYLLGQGANPSIATAKATPKQTHLIHIAASTGQIEVVKKFIAQDSTLVNALTSYNETPLLLAASQDYHDMVILLLAAGAAVNLSTQLPQEHPIYAQHHNHTALDWAIARGHSKTIEVLRNAGAQTNNEHTTIKNINLNQMIQTNNLNYIKILIQHNKTLVHHISTSGFSLLQIASAYGYTEIMDYLLDEGADLEYVAPDTPGKSSESRYSNMTAFEIAVSKRQYKSAILLLNRGASIPRAIPGKNHLIHLAVNAGDTALVKRLISHDNTLLDALSHSQKKPLDYAGKRGHAETISLLENATQLNQLVQSEEVSTTTASTATSSTTETSSNWCAYLTHGLWTTSNDSKICAETKSEEKIDAAAEEVTPMIGHIKRS